MLIFTLRAKRLIGNSILDFGDDSQLAIWRRWVAAHPEVRRGPNDPWDDGKGPMPTDVRDAALSSLRRRLEMMMRRFETEKLSEDEVADLSNDLADIRSVTKSLENPYLGVSAT
jgi:hypothetical protein